MMLACKHTVSISTLNCEVDYVDVSDLVVVPHYNCSMEDGPSVSLTVRHPSVGPPDTRRVCVRYTATKSVDRLCNRLSPTWRRVLVSIECMITD